jgi:hypothetical protein
MTEAEKKKMQEQGAIGNSPVETKKGGANAEPVLKSPNESVTPAPQPILSNEQIAQNREANIAAKEQVLSSIAKDIESQPQKRIVEEHKEKIIEKPQAITAEKRGFIPEEYKYTEFNRAKAEKDVQEQQSFKDMLDQIRIQNNEHKERMETARNNAKYNALGNLLVSLGQIAGGGKQTYVKPTTGKYLTESMAKSDEARKMYDAVREKNQSKRDNALKDAVAALERQHIQNENMKAKAIENRNKINQKAYVDNQKLKLQEEQNKIDSDYKKGLISLKEYQNQTSRISALASQLNAQTNANKQDMYTYPLRFTDTDTNTQYKLDNGTIKQIAAMMSSTGDYDKGTKSLLDKIAMSDSDIDYTKEANLQIKVQEFIDKNIASNEKLRKLISTVPREKVTSKPLPAKYNL